MNCIFLPPAVRRDRDVSSSASPGRRETSVHSLRCFAILAVLLLSAAGVRAQASFGNVPVGQSNPLTEQTVTVTAQAAGTVSSIEVLTLGQSSLDFAKGNGASCQGAVLTVGGATPSCGQSVSFVPAAPGLRIGAVVLLNSSGAVLGTTLISGTGLGGLGVLLPGNLLPVAGDGGYLGAIQDGGPATGAELYWPTSQLLDGAGNLYIADSRHNRIRMVCASANPASATIKGTYANCTGAGIIVTIAGNGNSTYTGDNGAASDATLNDPSGLAMDGAGNLYIADTGNNVIREISAATGIITTIAGSNPANVCGSANDTVGDGCPATQATFDQPVGVTLDVAGNLYIADTNDHRIRLVTISNGDISTIAGNGTITDAATGAGGYSGDNGKAINAELNYPYTIAFDPSGNMYIPDSGNNVVREVAAIGGVITTNSIITTFAGNGTQGYQGDGSAANSSTVELDSPLGAAVDAAGNVFIADSGNHALRKVSAANGEIATLLKTGTGTYYYNSAFTTIILYGPSGLYLDGMGNLYIADSSDMFVRELQGNYVALDYPTPVRQYSQSAPIDQTVENDGNAPLDITVIKPDTNATTNDTGITDPCSTAVNLDVDTDCAIGAVLAPQVASNPLIANIDVGQKGDTIDAPLDIQLIGSSTAVNSTTITVTGSPNPAGYGQPVTLTATVQTGSSSGNLTGTVTFYYGATVIAANVPVGSTTAGANNTSSATASTTTNTLPVGIDDITVTYNVANDPAHLTSNNDASPFPETILEATTTTLTTSGSPSTVGQLVTFTATVAISSAGGGVTPTGTVTFYDGANALQSVNLTTSGMSATASYSTSALTQGSHTITAQYSGDAAAEVQASTSNPVTQDVQAGTTVAVTNGSPNPSNYGQQVTFTAVVTPTGTGPATGAVKFYYGTTLIGTGNLVGTTNQTTIPYSGLPVGTDNITAQYVGDVNNASSNSTVPYQQMVKKTQTSTTVSALPQPNGIAGGSVTITATVQIVSGSSATIGGTVSFTSNGNSLGAPVAVNPSTGIATLTLNNVPLTTYSIVAMYSGDSNDDTSTSTPAYPYTIVQATTQTAVTATPNPALVGQTVTFSATVTGNGGTPEGTVTFEANGAAIGAPVTLNAGTATLTSSSLAAGPYTITAIYSGDTDDQGSTGQATAQLVIGAIPTATDLASASTTGTNPQVVLVAAVLNSEQVTGGATPTPTGTVTFKTGTTVIGTATLDSNAVATLPLNLPAGTYTIVAVYNPDPDHSGSTSQPVTISTTATDFNISVTPGSVSMAANQYYTLQVNLTSVGGFSDNIGLGCASLPVTVTCHFTPISVALAANGTATAQLILDTNNPLTGGSQAMNSHTGGGRAVLAGLVAPFALFFGWVFWRFRRRNTRFLTLVLVLALSAAALLATGCGGFSSSKAATGTFTIQVTGTGLNSEVIHYQSITLTIT